MSSNIVTFWLPNLLPAAKVEALAPQIRQLQLPSLKKLLSKADRFAVKPGYFAEQACYLMHLSKTLPVAPVTASVELETFDANLFWLRVDPVQMVPDRDQLLLMPSEILNIQASEARALIDAFNAHFAQDQVQLTYGSPSRWYLSIKQPVDIQSTPLEKVVWQSVGSFMPQGNAQTYWRQLLNETQMLFYSHPVNQQRRDAGLPEINSVWIWGEGILPESSEEGADWTIYSEDIYIKGLANFKGARLEKVPKNNQAWLFLAQTKRHFMYPEDLNAQLANQNESEWLSALQTLEADWFAGFEAQLKSGVIDSLLLDLGQGQRFHLTPKHLKKFWRFTKPLDFWV